MKKLIGAVLGLALAAGLGWACSNSGNAGNGGSVAVSGACGDLISTYCNKTNECSPFAITQEFGDVSTCISRTNLSCSRFDQLPGTSWTSQKLETCTASIRASSCQDLSAGLDSDACGSAPGMLANGSPCADDSQCSGWRCDKSTQSDGGFSTGDTICGKCVTRPVSTCGDAGACTTPQSCQYDSVSGTSSCVTRAPEGSACSTKVPCVSGSTCKNELCVKRAGNGAACEAASDCDSSLGLSCIAMTCQVPSLVGPGQTCAYPSPRCSTGSNCISSFSTDGGSTSVCVANAPDNGPCDDSKGPRCTSPARCTSGICTVPDYSQCK